MRGLVSRVAYLFIAMTVVFVVTGCGKPSEDSEKQEPMPEALIESTANSVMYGIVGEEEGTKFTTTYLSMNIAPQWVCDPSGTANEHIDEDEYSGYQVVVRSPETELDHNRLYIYVYDNASYPGCDDSLVEQEGWVENVRDLTPITIDGFELAGQQFTHPAKADEQKQYESVMYKGVVKGHWVEIAVADSSDDSHIVNGADVASMISSISIL